MEPKQLLDNLSTHLKNSIARAIAIASALHHEHVGVIHLLFGVFEEPGAIGAELLKKAGLKKETIEIALARFDKIHFNPTLTPTLTVPELNASAKKILERAMLLAYERSQTYIGTEHLLYGIFYTNEHHDELQALGLNVPEMQGQILMMLDSSQHFPNMNDVNDVMEDLQSLARELSEQASSVDEYSSNDEDEQFLEEKKLNSTPEKQSLNTAQNKNKKDADKKRPRALDVFAIELTSKDHQKKLDPVIGRELEIERLIHIVCRRNKNNPVLVGEPGVGKTAIVEGLAKRIAERSVPEVLQRKKIYAVDLPLLISGTIYRGEFEARLKQLIDECSADPNAILFIDEIHNIIGAGSNSGTMDAANILKPALARGVLHCIGATTIDEFKKHIMSDPALERRFQQIEVEEPNIADATQMLAGIKKYYEQFHNVKITDTAISAAVHLSTQYVHGQFLPDKAIDLLDESSASVRVNKKPSVQEKKIRELEQKRDDAYLEKESAIKDERLEEAMTIKSRISKLESTLSKLKKSMDKIKKKPTATVDDVTIATTLGKRLHIDPKLLLQNEFERLSTLAPSLKTEIVGQDTVIDTVVQTLQQSYLNTNTTRKGPRTSLLFAGPSGVGKTKLAQVLAKTLFFDDSALLRMDMSEFSEAHGVSKLLGSPAGYIGYKERNRFLDALSKRPQCVVLFDEFDKAHGDVKKLLYQILDDGILTDSSGKKYSFKHALVILTTNIGAELYTNSGVGFTQKEKIQTHVHQRIQTKLKEELGGAFLGRLGNVCIFSPLDKGQIEQIIKKHIDTLNETIKEKQRISLELDAHALDALIKTSAINESGARIVERAAEHLFFEQATKILAKNKTGKKKQWVVTHTDGNYVIV